MYMKIKQEQRQQEVMVQMSDTEDSTESEGEVAEARAIESIAESVDNSDMNCLTPRLTQ